MSSLEKTFCIFVFVDLVVPQKPKMDRGSTSSGLTTAKLGKNQQAGSFVQAALI